MDEQSKFPGFKDVNDFSQSILRNLMEATKCSNALPSAGEEFEYNSSFLEFQHTMNHQGTRLLNMIQSIMRHHGVRGSIAANNELMETDDRFDILVDANDQLLERVGILLDEASGVKKDVSLVVVSRTPKQQQLTASSWNKKITPKSGSKTPNYTLLTAKNITRPQQKFQKIDNSNRPFVPKIKFKPNAMKSLADSLAYMLPESQEDLDPSFVYPHPYQYELDSFEPEDSLLQRVVAKVPQDLNLTPLIFVSTEEELRMLCQKLKQEHEIAIDLEHHSFRSFQGFTCLMQISTRKEDFIVDTLELREVLLTLNDVFTDPKIVKVLHGADMDIQWLQKDFGLYVVNMFDTGQASRVLGFPHHSLAHLLEHYCNVQADKQYQLADWRIRPLPQELIKYAREDTHYLLYIYDCIRNDLLYRSNGQSNMLVSVIHNSTNICKKRYQKPRFTENSHKELYFFSQSKEQTKKELNSRQMEALKNIYAWRDKLARQEDESTGYILPNHMMLQMAEYLPKEQEGVLACCKPIPPFVRKELLELHRIIQEARDRPMMKPETPQSEKRPSNLQHPKFYVNSLLNCPHDFSHQLSEIDSSVIQLDNSMKTSKSAMFGAGPVDMDTGFVLPVEIKTKPLINLSDNIQNSPKKTSAQKQAAKIQAMFVNPFLRYLPSKQPANSEEVMENCWRLLPNTQPTVAVKTLPVVQVIKTSSVLNFDETEQSTPEPASSTIREQLSSERKRKLDTSDVLESPFMSMLKKKKEKKEKKLPDEQFKPFDYEVVDFDKILEGDGKSFSGNSSEAKKKKKKDFDPSSRLADSDHKPASRTHHGSSNNKSMTYSSKDGSSASRTPKIQWPKK